MRKCAAGQQGQLRCKVMTTVPGRDIAVGAAGFCRQRQQQAKKSLTRDPGTLRTEDEVGEVEVVRAGGEAEELGRTGSYWWVLMKHVAEEEFHWACSFERMEWRRSQ